MALRHKAFLLDELGFLEKITPILVELDKGNSRPLFASAVEVVQSKRENWILSSIGDVLYDITQYDYTGRPYQEPFNDKFDKSWYLFPPRIGYWLVIVFSDYLRYCTGIGNNYELLSFCLEKIGWKVEDIHLLLGGVPTSRLLQKDIVTQPPRLLPTDPYWFWMRPYQTKGGGGWLSRFQIEDLFDKLQKSRKQIAQFNPSLFGQRFGKLIVDGSEGQLDYLQRAQEAFFLASSMIDKAKEKDRSLYMVIAYDE